MVQGAEDRKPADVFRDTPLRYFGYANEVGEAFRPIYPRFVTPSYGIAFAYVGADSLTKTWTAYHNGSSHSFVAATFVDCLTWQTLASVLVPGKVINVVTAMSANAIQNSMIFKSQSLIHKYGATVIGMCCIPMIIRPIDEAVDILLDSTLRKVLPKHDEDHGT